MPPPDPRRSRRRPTWSDSKARARPATLAGSFPVPAGLGTRRRLLLPRRASAECVFLVGWGGQWTLFSRCCVRVGLPRALAVSFHSVAQWEGRGVCRARRSGPRVSGGRGYLPTWVGLGWVLGLG